MTDESRDKPVDKEYARARLGEIKRMLADQTAHVTRAVVPDAKPAMSAAVPEQLHYEPYHGTVDELLAAFEKAAERDDANVEYWSARALMRLLGYGDYWRNFEGVIARAKIACFQGGHNDEDHFADVSKMVGIGSGAERMTKDVRVTRYGAYMIALNGDSRKKQVAFAQNYFAVQTRRQEIQDERQQPQLSEDQRRVMLRDEMITHNKKLVSAAKSSGVASPLDFAVFQNHGYKGLYGGLDRRGIQNVKALSAKADILDHMGSTELAANLFRATQTEDKLRREQIQGKDRANATHYEVGRQVRKAIQDIGGTMPEKLEPAENIGKVRRRLAKPTAPDKIE